MVRATCLLPGYTASAQHHFGVWWLRRVVLGAGTSPASKSSRGGWVGGGGEGLERSDLLEEGGTELELAENVAGPTMWGGWPPLRRDWFLATMRTD